MLEVLSVSLNNVIPGVSSRKIAVPAGKHGVLFQLLAGRLDVVLTGSTSDGIDGTTGVEVWSVVLDSAEASAVNIPANFVVVDDEFVPHSSYTSNRDFDSGV